MSHIQSLHIRRFKAIIDAPFDVEDVNVFIGANNSGKSTLMQALHFSVGLLQAIELEDKWGGGETLSVSLSPTQLIYAPSEDLYALGQESHLKEEKATQIEVSFVLGGGQSTTVSVRRGRNRNIVVAVDDVNAARTLASLDNPFTIFSPGLAGVAKSENYVSNGVLLRTIARGDANLVLRNILLRLWQEKGKSDKWDSFMQDVTEIFPELNVEVAFADRIDQYIRVSIRTGSGLIPLELAGTGVLQAVQILSYVHCFSPKVVVLDEPDSHLHPNNQRLLCKLLSAVAEERNTQILLTTHSRHVVDALSGQANFLWVRNGTVDRASQGYDLAILLDIGALDVKELITRADTDCIVLTEDERKRNIEILLESSGFPMDRTVVLAYYGCTIPHNLRPLLDVVRNSNPGARVIVHRDRDYLTDEEANRWETEIRALKSEPFLTEGVDLESHFLSAPHLAELNASLTEDGAQSVIDEATSETGDRSIEKYINGRVDIEKKQGTYGKLNVGALATEARRALKENALRYRHSKTVMRKVRFLHQQKTQNNLVSGKGSEFLKVTSLETIRRKIFPGKT